jgi:hypothetical protein
MSDLLVHGGAEISEDGKYRWLLWRRWDKEKPRLGFIMLNPSTADAQKDDATIRVCMGRARRMGYGGIRVVNLFPYRATKPQDLKQCADPFGEVSERNNESYLTGVQDSAFGGIDPIVIAAWGDDGMFMEAQRKALSLICGDYGRRLYHLGLTKAGRPRHPLRIPYVLEPQVWIDGREGWLQRNEVRTHAA